MEERLQRTPSDFAEILSRKELPLLVGGQAVNIWAEIYSGRVPRLLVFDPFVSRDADIFGTRELAVELGNTPGWNCRVVKLVRQLPADPAMWTSLSRRFNVSVSVGLCMPTRNKGFELSPELLRYLGERGPSTTDPLPGRPAMADVGGVAFLQVSISTTKRKWSILKRISSKSESEPSGRPWE